MTMGEGTRVDKSTYLYRGRLKNCSLVAWTCGEWPERNRWRYSRDLRTTLYTSPVFTGPGKRVLPRLCEIASWSLWDSNNPGTALLSGPVNLMLPSNMRVWWKWPPICNLPLFDWLSWWEIYQKTLDFAYNSAFEWDYSKWPYYGNLIFTGTPETAGYGYDRKRINAVQVLRFIQTLHY